MVDDVAVVRRDQDGRVPVEAQGLVAGRDVLDLAGVEIGPGHRAELRLVVEVAVRDRVEHVVEAVAAADRLPVLEGDAAAAALAAGPADRPVVLQAARDVVGIHVVVPDRVELRERQLVGVVPVLAAVVRDAHAVVVAQDDVLRVRGVDPHRVVVAAEPERHRPGLAAVGGVRHADRQHVDVVRVVRVDADLHVVVAGPAADLLLVGAHLLPGLAAVIRPVDFLADHAVARLAFAQFLQPVGIGHARLVRVLDVRVDNERVLRVDIQADAAQHAAGQAPAELVPGLSGVGRLVDAAARASQVERPGQALLVVRGGIEDLRVLRIHDEVGRADHPAVGLDLERLGPGLAAVDRLVDAALVVRGIEVAQRRHVDDVGVHRVDDDAADVMGVFEAHVGPRLARVDRLVDPVAPVGAARGGVLARADPDDLRIGVGHRDIADRDDGLIVEDRRPADAVVHRLPEAARTGRRVDRVRLLRRHREVDEAAALARRADRAELEGLRHVRRQGLGAEIGGEECENERGRGERAGQPEKWSDRMHAMTPYLENAKDNAANSTGSCLRRSRQAAASAGRRRPARGVG